MTPFYNSNNLYYPTSLYAASIATPSVMPMGFTGFYDAQAADLRTSVERARSKQQQALKATKQVVLGPKRARWA